MLSRRNKLIMSGGISSVLLQYYEYFFFCPLFARTIFFFCPLFARTIFFFARGSHQKITLTKKSGQICPRAKKNDTACMVHHGLMGLRLCISTIGISTTYCNEPNNYPPKRCMSATTIILMLCSKSMHRWNPLCKGFILSHFDGHVAWGNIAF